DTGRAEAAFDCLMPAVVPSSLPRGLCFGMPGEPFSSLPFGGTSVYRQPSVPAPLVRAGHAKVLKRNSGVGSLPTVRKRLAAAVKASLDGGSGEEPLGFTPDDVVALAGAVLQSLPVEDGDAPARIPDQAGLLNKPGH